MGYEKRVHEAMRSVAAEGLAESAHDLSDGGLACALALSAACGIGADIAVRSDLRAEHLLFHEGPSRILISTSHPDKVQAIAQRYEVACPPIGATMKERLQIRNADQTLIQAHTSELQQHFEAAFPKLLHHA
jgi:phosphoribosylformylglycinamidine synthase subunit PurL